MRDRRRQPRSGRDHAAPGPGLHQALRDARARLKVVQREVRDERTGRRIRVLASDSDTLDGQMAGFTATAPISTFAGTASPGTSGASIRARASTTSRSSSRATRPWAHQHYSTTQRYLHHKPRREDAARLADAFGQENNEPGQCRRRRKHEASGNQRQSGESCGASPGVRVLGEPWVQLQPSDRAAMAIERSRG